MAHVSQPTQSSDSAAVSELPQEPNCELVDIKPFDNCSQSDIFQVLPEGRKTFSVAGLNNEKLHLENVSGDDLTYTHISPDTCCYREADLGSECPVDSKEKTDQERNQKSTGLPSKEEWRLINFEPSVQIDVLYPEKESREEFGYLAQPGPSRVKGRNSYNLSGPVNEWKLTGAKHCHPQVSSRNKHSEELPGPSRIKAHSTILKKNPDRQPHTENTTSAQPEQLKSFSDSHQSQDVSDHSSQLTQLLKQSSEKEHHKRVHFEPRSECEQLTLCDRGYIGRDTDTTCPSAKQIIRALTRDDEKIEAEESLIVGSTRHSLHSHLMQSVENDKENTKGMDSKAALQSNMSIAVNENASANNNPTKDGRKSIKKDPGHDSDEIQAAHQPAVRMQNQRSTISQGDLLDHSSNISKLDITSRIPADLGQSGTDIVSQPETPINETDHNIIVHKADKKQRGHTEKMVALFTNLQGNKLTPTQSDKFKRVKSLEGKIADYVHCFDERVAKSADKRSALLTTDKSEKSQTLYNTKPSAALQSSNSETRPQTSRKLMQNIDLHGEKKRTLNTSKHSVEAVLLVLNSMQSILVRMARAANSKTEGNTEQDEFLKAPLNKERKKHPWESVCPKDSEVTSDGLFAYNIAHQVIGQAFKKITELYPACAALELLDSACERELADRNSASGILALTAMKDALRELEGPAAYKFYTSTGVETSDSLISISMENISDEKVGSENVEESKSVVLNIINDVIERVTSASKEIHEDRSKSDQVLSLTSPRDGSNDSLNTELKRMSFELVSRTVKEAVSGLLKTKAQSMSDTTCDRTQPLSVKKIDTKNRAPSDTEAIIHVPCSTTTSENMQYEDQPVMFLVQSISNEIYDLISKLFSHLETTDCREKLDFLMTDIGKDLSTPVDAVCDKSATFSSKLGTINGLLEESHSNLASRTVQPENVCGEDSTDSSTDKECVLPDTKNLTMKHSNLVSQQISEDTVCVALSPLHEEHTPEAKLTSSYTSEKDTSSYTSKKDFPGSSSEHSALVEELCQSNESTKCINSGSQATDSSMAHLFDMDVENSGSRMMFEGQSVEISNSPESFEYSTPSTLLSMRTDVNSREGNILDSIDFGHLYMVQSSDMWMTPTRLLRMCGGNHPEHVQQADQNRPSCSQCPHGQNSVEVSEKAALSKSMTTAAKDKKKTGCWNTQCSTLLHHQTRPSKLLDNPNRNKQSCSEPKLDFYKRTKVADCSLARKPLHGSPDSEISEWSVFGFYPPRDDSDSTVPENEGQEEDNLISGTEVDQDGWQVDSEFDKIEDSCFQEYAASRSSGALSNSKDEPGCLSTDTEGSTNDSLEKQNSGSWSLLEKAQPVSNARHNESQDCLKENDVSTAIRSTSKDNERSNEEEQGVWQDIDRTSSLENKERLSDIHLSGQTSDIHKFCDINELPPKMPCVECSFRSHTVGKMHSACDFIYQKQELSSDVHPCCQKRRSSSLYLNDPLKDFDHTSFKNSTSDHCSSPLVPKHSNSNLKPGTDNPAALQCGQMQKDTRNRHHPLADPVSHSSCCSSSIRSAESEMEEECSCRKRFCHEEFRNCGHRGRSTSSVDDICGHRVRKCQVAGASASVRCASLDSQLQNNNKNINGIGRGLENSSSKILTPSTTSTASGQHDSAVDTVHDKFSQLQSQLNVGVDSLKDYIATLCLALKNNQTPGEQAAWRGSEHPPPHLPSSAFCCSPSSSPPPPGRIPHILKSCSRHSPPWEVTPCDCCVSRRERTATGYCQKRSAVLVSPGMYSLCRNSGKSFEACHCCSAPRQNLSGPRCSSRLADNRIDKGSCCQLALVEMKVSPSTSSLTSCADVPQLACLSSPGASPTPSPHSSQYHCTCQRGHGTIPETWEPSSSQVEDFTDRFDHRRICRLHKTRSHRMKKSHFWATSRSSFHSVSFKESRSSTENSDSESAFGNKETNTLVSNVCERSFPNNKAKRKDLLQASGNNERLDEATADQQKINLGADATGASSLEVREQNSDEQTQSKVERVHRAVGSDHSCQTTVVSPRVVDIAVSIVEALLRAQNSGIPYLQKHLLPCRRVGSSSVDHEIPSCESQTMAQSENLAEREEYVNNICRKLLNDVAQQNFCSTDSKVQNTDLRCGSERTTGNNNVDSSEAKCTCSVPPVHSSSSGTSCDVDKLEKSLHRTLFGEQLEKQQNNDCGKQDKGTVGLLARCSHKYEKSQNVLSTKTNNENRSNSSASKYCTFLVCVGEENHSSALVIQPLVPSDPVQFKDSACQASDESVCTSLETSANWAQRQSSEMSIASSFRSITSEGENVETADDTNQKSSRLYGAVMRESPSSLSGKECESLSSSPDSAYMTRRQSGCKNSTGRNYRRKRSPKSPELRSSSVDILQGVCEISHSSCETCQKDAAIPVSDPVSASTYCEQKPFALYSESGVTDHATGKAEKPVNNNVTGCPLEVADLHEPSWTDGIVSQNKVSRSTSCSSVDAGTKNLSERNRCTTKRDRKVDPVCELRVQGGNGSSSTELLRHSTPVSSDSGNVDGKFQTESTQRGQIAPAVSCKSSHVDPSCIFTSGVSTGFLETCHSDSCVDCLLTDGGSNNIYSTVLASGSGEMNGQTGSETVLESTGSPLKEADDAVIKDTHLNVQSPVSGQTESESAGGDSSFPVDFSQCGLKDAPFPHAECSVDRESLGAHAGCYFSDSGILTDSTRPSVHSQHKDSPSCSMGSVSTTAVTSSCSSVANLSHASSPVDPFLGIYSLTKACPQTIGSTASTLDCPLEEYAQERKPGETSVFAGGSSSRNNSHKRVTAGSSTIVDCGAGGMDADLTVKRSWSSEQVQGSSRTGQSGTRDSWMSLELLNLNSRAARLAIESRVQSLQRILNDMESCTRVLTPSSGRPAVQQQPSSHSTASSLTASAAAAAAEAATAATPRDHWLRACNSEELVQMIYQQLQGLKTSAGHQKRPESAALPECEARDNTNTNTNHVPTRDACTNASCDTHSIGTITDICRQVAVTHCLCTIDKLHTGVSMTSDSVQIDVMHYSDAFSTVDHRHDQSQRVCLPSNENVPGKKSDIMKNSDFAEGDNGVSERCDDQNVQAVRTSAMIGNISETRSAPELVDKGDSTETDSSQIHGVNHSELFGSLGVCEKAVVTENKYLKPNTRDFSDSFGVQVKTYKGVSAKLVRQKAGVVDFSDSFAANTKVQRKVRSEEDGLKSTLTGTSGCVRDKLSVKKEACLGNAEDVLCIKKEACLGNAEDVLCIKKEACLGNAEDVLCIKNEACLGNAEDMLSVKKEACLGNAEDVLCIKKEACLGNAEDVLCIKKEACLGNSEDMLSVKKEACLGNAEEMLSDKKEACLGNAGDMLSVKKEARLGNAEDMLSVKKEARLGNAEDVLSVKKEACLGNAEDMLSVSRNPESMNSHRKNSVTGTDTEHAESHTERIDFNSHKTRFNGTVNNHCEYCPSAYEMDPSKHGASGTPCSKPSTSGRDKNQYAGNGISTLTIHKFEDSHTELDQTPVKGFVCVNGSDSSENGREVDTVVENSFTGADKSLANYYDLDGSDTDSAKRCLKECEAEPFRTSAGGSGSGAEMVENRIEGGENKPVPVNGVGVSDIDPAENGVNSYNLKSAQDSIGGKSQKPAGHSLDGREMKSNKIENGIKISVDSATNSCSDPQSTCEILSVPDYLSKSRINTVDTSPSRHANCIDRIETRIAGLFSFLIDPKRTGGNLKRELEGENTATVSFGATLNRQRGTKRQKLNDTRNQGACGAIQEDFTPANTRSFSDGDIAMITKECDCCAMAAKDGAVRRSPPLTVNDTGRMETKEKTSDLPGTKEELKKPDSACSNRNNTKYVSSHAHSTMANGNAAETNQELTIKTVLAPLSGLPDERENNKTTAVGKTQTDQLTGKAKQHTNGLSTPKSLGCSNSHYKLNSLKKRIRISKKLSKRTAVEKHQNSVLILDSYLAKRAHKGREGVTKGKAVFGVRNSHLGAPLNGKSKHYVASFKHGNEDNSIYAVIVSARGILRNSSRANNQDQAGESSREFPKSERGCGCEKSVQCELLKEKRQMSGETEDVLRDLDDSSFGDKMFGMDAGVQCDILMSCTVPRPRSREVEDCKSRNLTGFSNTDRLSSKGSKAEEASSSVADAGQQRQSSEGEVLRQYRRRVRSLEQALDLERDLHTITRASLRDLTSDHDAFRDSMLLLHDRPRSHRSGDGRREMLRHAVERTGAAQSLWQDCVRGARERERDSVRRGMGP